MHDALEVRDLTKTYGQGAARVHALRNISFSIEKGKFILIVGSSGSGKSTLLHMIGLLDRPSDGKVIIDGTDTAKLNEGRTSTFRNKKLGFIFQFSNLLADLSVIENVMLPCQIDGRAGNIRGRAKSLLRAVGMEEYANKRANAISGGQAQRTAIARGLINDPVVVLADEPTGNLDSVSAKLVVDLMKSVARKTSSTFVVVTHDREQFGEVDKIITLKDGRIVDDIAAEVPAA